MKVSIGSSPFFTGVYGLPVVCRFEGSLQYDLLCYSGGLDALAFQKEPLFVLRAF